ncbi:MAG: 2,3-bisphosphoglycerate-independent phosphoglycerate mutase [Oscillospiraceae bacterium]|nr:2,3-bisphosphoglycerate-independent phosphoglycerate mutase [Oscillospiraceae bacterium]
MSRKPVLLCILDGYANNPEAYGNAIKAAKTPNLDRIFAENPATSIGASGMDVGLLDGQMGNSEVGHTNIGAGRVVVQELTRITKSVIEGDFFTNPVLLRAIENCKENGSALHLMGLVSDGGVHSHSTHLYALLELAKKQGLGRVFIHCLLDGRDVPPMSGKEYIADLQCKIDETGVGRIATVMGRYYAMDRERRFERVEKAYRAMVYGDAPVFTDACDMMALSYENGVTDEFVVPCRAADAEPVKANDSFVFFNFRPDRAREITRAFVDDSFDGFARGERLPLYYVCMTQYDADMPNVAVAFAPLAVIDMPLGAVLSQNGLRQLRIAEYTKYAHVTFFLNGGEETVYPGEDRILIDSPDVPTYDLKPEMSAYEVTDTIVDKIEKDMYDVIVLNYANCDMVGHTGVFGAAVAAVETVDTCVGRVWDAVSAKGGVMFITADHGNADKMYEPDGSPFTAHTTFPVPFVVLGYPCGLREGGRLCDISPTVLRVLGLAQPESMTGVSLIAE